MSKPKRAVTDSNIHIDDLPASLQLGETIVWHEDGEAVDVEGVMGPPAAPSCINCSCCRRGLRPRMAFMISENSEYPLSSRREYKLGSLGFN